MTVKAWLKGHKFDLQTLADLVPSGDVTVTKEADEFYLTSPALVVPATGDLSVLHTLARQLLRQVCGLARVIDPSFEDVQVTGHYTEGERTHALATPATVRGRVRILAGGVVTGDAVPPQPQAVGPSFLSIAASNPRVAEALEIMDGGPLNWIDLYMVYEILKRAGALRSASTAAGISNNTLSRFRQTANYYRHAPSNEQLPGDPMTIRDARQLISRLVKAWVDSLP